MPLDWHVLLKERNAWVAHNFPSEDGHIEQSVFGVEEENGELAHAHLKAMQGIRGSQAKHDADAKDAIGDLTIYLLGVMRYTRYTPGSDSYEPTMTSLLVSTPDEAKLRLGRAVGQLCLLPLDGRASFRVAIDRIVYYARRYCDLRGWDYDQVVTETWQRVKQRDWIADPVAGGE